MSCNSLNVNSGLVPATVSALKGLPDVLGCRSVGCAMPLLVLTPLVLALLLLLVLLLVLLRVP